MSISTYYNTVAFCFYILGFFFDLIKKEKAHIFTFLKVI